MEELMVKAIRQFKREHKKCEIRSVCVYESYGQFGKTSSALFHIEYCEGFDCPILEIDYNVSK